MGKRIGWLDSAKGFGIIMIVLGHTGFPFSQYIFWFHVPLFFILSGMTLNLEKKFPLFLISKINSLIIPYFTFGLFFATWYFLIIDKDSGAFYNNILSLVQGGKVATGIIGAYWFLLVLFLSEILLFILSKLFPEKITMVVVLLLFVAFYFWYEIAGFSTNLFWGFQLVPLASVFIFIGLKFRKILMHKNLCYFALIFIGLFLVYNQVFHLDYHFDMKYSIFGNPFFAIFVPLSISIIIIQFFIRIESLPIADFFKWFGQSSLIIMLSHNFFIHSLSHYTNTWYLAFIFALVASIIFSIAVTKVKILKAIFLPKIPVTRLLRNDEDGTMN